MPITTVVSYLTFGGRCEEAIEFYRKAIGAQVDMVMHFNEAPQPPPSGVLAPGFEKKVMHAAFRVGGTQIMASDGCNADSKFAGFSLSLNVETIEEADRYFAAPGDGGLVTMPLSKTFWSPRFGMVTDRFGISWMVIVPAKM